jgi:uncharacterized protein (TIGR02147 family)
MSAQKMISAESAVILRAALARLNTKNRKLSLRALAGRLELSPSYLSKVFRGERPLPLRLLPALARALQLDHHEISELQRLALHSVEKRELGDATGIRTVSRKDSALVSEFENFSSNDYWLLDQWYHLPLLNLATTKGFDPAPEKVAARLGISVAEARDSLMRLIQSGHLQWEDSGGIRRSKLKLRFPTQRSHPSVRAFHRSMIRRAHEAMQQEPSQEEFQERLISGVNLAGDPARLTEAKLILEEAVYRAAELLAGGECSEVFQVNLQLFKLSRK